MPAPDPATMSAAIVANFASSLGPEGSAYITKLATAICTGWTQWQLALTFGGVAVQGAGMGAWAGQGAKGTITGSPYQLPEVQFAGNTPEQTAVTKALGVVLTKQFGTWVSSYVITSVAFIGTSTSTAESPGVFTAMIVPIGAGQGGKGTNPTGISDEWVAALPRPMFNPDSPQAQIKQLTKAVAKAIEMEFASKWLNTSLLSLNVATGPAAPAGGVGQGTSTPTGKIV